MRESMLFLDYPGLYKRLSQEACNHALHNESLQVQMKIEVLYFEQITLKNAMNGNHYQLFFGSKNGQFPQCSSSCAGTGAIYQEITINQ